MTVPVTLSLISHTNVGKTTLARTLLRRDVGEVLDRAHVTDASEAHTLIETDSAVLRLWDTPGFGDTARLARRLRHERDPLGWFLHRVWDRVLDRPMYCSQAAVRNVRDEADVVLYLVNAAEDPRVAGYVPLELEILNWMGRPVLMLLNQVGRDGERLLDAWRDAASRWSVVAEVLSLDAFTRCWVEEGLLLRHVEAVLPQATRGAMRALRGAWEEEQLGVFRSTCRQMAGYLWRAARDRETAAAGRESAGAVRDAVGRIGDVLKLSTADRKRAMGALNKRLDQATQEMMETMLAAHGLTGSSAARIEARIHEFELEGGGVPLDERSGALLGGAISGALGGLTADALSGGLSLGGGLIAGAILGALGGAALGKGYRLIRGDREPAVTWSAGFLDRLCRQVLLRYLAVAHFGRGRGDYRDLEQPDHWSAAVEAELYARQGRLHEIWSAAEGAVDGRDGGPPDELYRVVESTARAVLLRSYPHASDVFA
jgi:hypothetical protein